MKRTLLTLTALIALTSATGAQALITGNGLSLNGLGNNGLGSNAITGNAFTSNALTNNGLGSNGLQWNALTDNALTNNAVRSHGWAAEQPTAYLPVPVVVFAITLPDGSVLTAAPAQQ